MGMKIFLLLLCVIFSFMRRNTKRSDLYSGDIIDNELLRVFCIYVLILRKGSTRRNAQEHQVSVQQINFHMYCDLSDVVPVIGSRTFALSRLYF